MKILKKRIQKNVLKNQKPRVHYLIAQGDHRKTIKVIKVLRAKCAPLTGTTKGIVMADNNVIRYILLFRHADHH